MPSIFLIAVFLTVLGLGFTNNMVALAVLAIGPILTNAYLGVDGVDARRRRGGARDGHVERRASSARSSLPLALPLLYIGIRIAAVTVVATAPIAAYAGGGGLGDIIANQADLPPLRRPRRVDLRDGAVGGSMGGPSCVTESHYPQRGPGG